VGIIDITGNKVWLLLISQEIKKCMGIIDITGGKSIGMIDITGNKGWILLISQEIKTNAWVLLISVSHPLFLVISMVHHHLFPLRSMAPHGHLSFAVISIMPMYPLFPLI
jgi:hypothetical protein